MANHHTTVDRRAATEFVVAAAEHVELMLDVASRRQRAVDFAAQLQLVADLPREQAAKRNDLATMGVPLLSCPRSRVRRSR